MKPFVGWTRRWLVSAAALAALGAVAPSAWAEVQEGAQLPENSRKVGEHRYRSPLSYEDTKKYYKFAYPEATFQRRTIADQPGVRAFHIALPPGKGLEGLNIYESNEEVRVFVVPETVVAKPVKKKVTSAPRRR
jgi:hypothetical protein